MVIETIVYGMLWNTVKPWIVITCAASIPQDEQAFVINFNLINERHLAIWVVHDVGCHTITTEPKVLEVHFDIQVFWVTIMFPERTGLTNHSFTVFHLLCQWFRILDLCQPKYGILSETRTGLRMGRDPTQSIEAQWLRHGLMVLKIHWSLLFWTSLGEEGGKALTLMSLQACERNLCGTKAQTTGAGSTGSNQAWSLLHIWTFDLDLISFCIV